MFFDDFGCNILLEALQTATFKLEVLLSIFWGIKNTLEWTAPLFLDLNPRIMPYPPINIEIFWPPII